MKQIRANRDFRQYWTAFSLVTGDVDAYEVVLKLAEDVSGTFTVTAKKPSGNTQFVSAGFYAGDARARLKNSMYDVPGETELYLAVYDDGGGKVTEKIILVQVESAPESGTIASDEVTELDSLIAQVTDVTPSGAYAQAMGDYAKEQGEYAKEMGDQNASGYPAPESPVYEDFDAVPMAAGVYQIGPQPGHAPDEPDDSWACQVLKTQTEGNFYQIATGGDSPAGNLKIYIRSSLQEQLNLCYTKLNLASGSGGTLELPVGNIPTSGALVYEFVFGVNTFNTQWKFQAQASGGTCDLFELVRQEGSDYALHYFDGETVETASAFSGSVLKANQQYKAQIVLDLAAKTHSLYIDGAAVYSGAAISGDTLGTFQKIRVVNQIGTYGSAGASLYFNRIGLYGYVSGTGGAPVAPETYLYGPLTFQERTEGTNPYNYGEGWGDDNNGNFSYTYAAFGDPVPGWNKSWTRVVLGEIFVDADKGVMAGVGAACSERSVVIGNGASANTQGVSVGKNASSYGGGAALGNQAEAGPSGGAVGNAARTGSGFAGGQSAKTQNASGSAIDAVQLGTGTNQTAKTLQVYDKQIVSYDSAASGAARWYLTDVGKPASLATTVKGDLVSAINELVARLDALEG